MDLGPDEPIVQGSSRRAAHAEGAEGSPKLRHRGALGDRKSIGARSITGEPTFVRSLVSARRLDRAERRGHAARHRAFASFFTGDTVLVEPAPVLGAAQQ